METQPITKSVTNNQIFIGIDNKIVIVTDNEPVTVTDKQPITITDNHPATIIDNRPVPDNQPIIVIDNQPVTIIDISPSSNQIHSHRSYANMTKNISQNICPISSRYASNHVLTPPRYASSICQNIHEPCTKDMPQACAIISMLCIKPCTKDMPQS
jgi:hypothetical protein